MARIKNGILGGINGKIGGAEGYIRNGIAYVRIKRRKSNKPPTEKQKAARQRMSLVNKFINTMTAFVGIGFAQVAKGQAFSANNAAKSYQLRNSLEGTYPDQVINYGKVLLTAGELRPAENAAIEIFENGMKFIWDCDPMGDRNYQWSVAMLLVYCKALDRSYFDLSGVKRTAKEQFVELPPIFKGHDLQVYLSFITDDRKAIANSVHVAQVMF